MNDVVSSAIRFRILVIAVAAMLAYFGADRARKMPADVLPEFNPPVIEVQTEAPGLSANEVEMMVSFGVEELLSGLPWLKTLASDSVNGLSTVRLEFHRGTDLMRARQLVQERLTSSFLLPNVAKPPVMQQPISSSNRIMMIAMSSKDVDPIKLSTLTIWTVKPRLMGIPGVANVSVWGERRRQIQVQMDLAKMQELNVRQNQVIASTGEALWMSPLSFLKASMPGTGGWVETPNQRLEIRHVLPMSSAEDIAKIGIDGTDLRLSNVATVVEGHPPMIGDAVLPEGKGVLLVVEKFPGADTLAVTRAVEEAMAGMRAGLTGVDVDVRAFRPATFVEWALADISRAALLALVFSMGALGLSVMQWRATLVGAAALLVAVLAAILVLYYRNAGLNTLTLSGFGVAFAVLIDEVVLVTDRILAHLHRGVNAGGPLDVRSAVRAGVMDGRRAVTFAVVIGLIAVAPTFFLGGVDGSISQPLSLSYALALTMGFVVVLTVVPALFIALGLPSDPAARAWQPAGQASAAIGRLSGLGLRSPAVTMAVAAGLIAAMVPAASKLPQALGSTAALMPRFAESDLVIQFDGPSGTSQGEMTRLASKALAELRNVPGVRAAYGHIGRAVGGDQVVNINSGRLWVSINSSADYAATLGGVRKILDGYPDVDRRIRTYLSDRLGTDAVGERRAVVRIYGQRTEELRTIARELKTGLGRIDGLGQVQIVEPLEEEQLHVTVDIEAAGRRGLKPGDVRRAASTIFSGLEVGRIFEQQKVFEVVVWSTPQSRASIDSVSNAMIELPNGGHVRLGEVAKVALKSTPALIKREGVSLYLDLVVDLGNRRPAAALAEVEAQVRTPRYPLGYFPAVIADGVAQGVGDPRAGVAMLVAVAGVVLLLQSCFGSWPLAFGGLLALALSASGGFAALSLLGLPHSLGSLFGLVGVVALAARWLVLLVTRWQTGSAPGIAPDADAVARGTAEMSVQIVTTTTCVVVATLPVLLNAGRPGLELLYPMTVVFLGGLVSTLLVMLLVLPGMYLRFGAERPAYDMAEVAP